GRISSCRRNDSLADLSSMGPVLVTPDVSDVPTSFIRSLIQAGAARENVAIALVSANSAAVVGGCPRFCAQLRTTQLSPGEDLAADCWVKPEWFTSPIAVELRDRLPIADSLQASTVDFYAVNSKSRS